MKGVGGGVPGMGLGAGPREGGLDGGGLRGRWGSKEEGGDPGSDSFFKTLLPRPFRYGALPPPWQSPCYRLWDSSAWGSSLSSSDHRGAGSSCSCVCLPH